MKKIRSVEPFHKRMADKFRNEVELPEIREKMSILRNMKYDIYHYKPSGDALREHGKNFENEMKTRLHFSSTKRAEQMKRDQKAGSHLHTKTQNRIRMQDELAKILREEKDEIKQR